MEREDRKTVLIVEDEAPMMRLLVQHFTKAQFAVLQAEDGVQGLELALAKHPDLIVLDILLPRMDGMTMMQRFRKDPRGKEVPIIILTNISANDAAIRQIVEDEPAYYLMKTDWQPEGVVEKAKEVLGL